MKIRIYKTNIRNKSLVFFKNYFFVEEKIFENIIK